MSNWRRSAVALLLALSVVLSLIPVATVLADDINPDDQIWEDDFEDGDLNGWDNTTWWGISSDSFYGNYSMYGQKSDGSTPSSTWDDGPIINNSSKDWTITATIKLSEPSATSSNAVRFQFAKGDLWLDFDSTSSISGGASNDIEWALRDDSQSLSSSRVQMNETKWQKVKIDLNYTDGFMRAKVWHVNDPEPSGWGANISLDNTGSGKTEFEIQDSGADVNMKVDNVTVTEGDPGPETYKVSGSAWNDSDDDGINDSGESGISGATVEVIDSDGNVEASTTTDVDGNWNVSVKNGTYSVDFSAAGYENETFDVVNVDGDATTGVSLGLVPTWQISGKVKDSEGSGIPDASVVLRDNSSGNIVNSTTSDSNGDYSLRAKNGTYDIEVIKFPYKSNTTTVTVSGGDVSQDLILLGDLAPYVINVSPKALVYNDSRHNVSLNFTVRDPEGSTINYTVHWYNKSSDSWEVVEQASGIANDTRVEVLLNVSSGGIHKWNVSVEDNTTLNSTFGNYRWLAPGEINVYNESDKTLVDGTTVTAELSSLESDYEDTLTTSNGTLVLNGVPNDEDIVVNISASGFHERNVVFDYAPGNYSVLLVEDGTAGFYNQTFALDDRTGNYPPGQTWLLVEQKFGGSWKAVESDFFGAVNEAVVELEDGTTYRLIVQNNDGDTRSLGQFDGDSSLNETTVTLTIESTDAGDINATGYAWNVSADRPDTGDPFIEFVFEAEEDSDVTDFRLQIYELDNKSANTIYDKEYGDIQNLTHTQLLNQTQANTTWVVEWSAKIDGREVGGKQVVSLVETDISDNIPLSQHWQTFGYVVLLIVIGGALNGLVNPEAGAVGLAAFASVFWAAGLTPGFVTGPILVLALMIGAGAYMRQRGRTA